MDIHFQVLSELRRAVVAFQIETMTRGITSMNDLPPDLETMRKDVLSKRSDILRHANVYADEYTGPIDTSLLADVRYKLERATVSHGFPLSKLTKEKPTLPPRLPVADVHDSDTNHGIQLIPSLDKSVDRTFNNEIMTSVTSTRAAEPRTTLVITEVDNAASTSAYFPDVPVMPLRERHSQPPFPRQQQTSSRSEPVMPSTNQPSSADKENMTEEIRVLLGFASPAAAKVLKAALRSYKRQAFHDETFNAQLNDSLLLDSENIAQSSGTRPLTETFQTEHVENVDMNTAIRPSTDGEPSANTAEAHEEVSLLEGLRAEDDVHDLLHGRVDHSLALWTSEQNHNEYKPQEEITDAYDDVATLAPTFHQLERSDSTQHDEPQHKISTPPESTTAFHNNPIRAASPAKELLQYDHRVSPEHEDDVFAGSMDITMVAEETSSHAQRHTYYHHTSLHTLEFEETIPQPSVHVASVPPGASSNYHTRSSPASSGKRSGSLSDGGSSYSVASSSMLRAAHLSTLLRNPAQQKAVERLHQYTAKRKDATSQQQAEAALKAERMRRLREESRQRVRQTALQKQQKLLLAHPQAISNDHEPVSEDSASIASTAYPTGSEILQHLHADMPPRKGHSATPCDMAEMASSMHKRLETEAAMAEEARKRAMQRAKARQRTMETAEQQAAREKQEEEARKWAKRDERIATFLKRQQAAQHVHATQKPNQRGNTTIVMQQVAAVAASMARPKQAIATATAHHNTSMVDPVAILDEISMLADNTYTEKPSSTGTVHNNTSLLKLRHKSLTHVTGKPKQQSDIISKGATGAVGPGLATDAAREAQGGNVEEEEEEGEGTSATGSATDAWLHELYSLHVPSLQQLEEYTPAPVYQQQQQQQQQASPQLLLFPTGGEEMEQPCTSAARVDAVVESEDDAVLPSQSSFMEGDEIYQWLRE